jgi:uncharacterized membrane protein YphA (DoxX/SURF4 family)
VQRIPWWHGKGLPPTSDDGSHAALAIAVAVISVVVAAAVAVLLGAPPASLGIAMLVGVVALPAALSLHRRWRG